MFKVLKWFLLIGISVSLQANDCEITYLDTQNDSNVLHYSVNGENIVVVFDKGIVYRVYGYVEQQRKETFKEAFIANEQICFGSDMSQCQSTTSLEQDVLAKIFLQKAFCEE